MRKLRDNALTSNQFLPLLIKHLKGYVPYDRHTCIACNKFPAGVDQFTETTFYPQRYSTIHETGCSGQRPQGNDIQQIPRPTAQPIYKTYQDQRSDALWQNKRFEGPSRDSFPADGLQASCIRHVRGNEFEREGSRRHGGAIRGGTFGGSAWLPVSRMLSELRFGDDIRRYYLWLREEAMRSWF